MFERPLAQTAKRTTVIAWLVGISTLSIGVGANPPTAGARASTNRSIPTSQAWFNPTGTATYEDWGFDSCNPPYEPGKAHLGADSQGTGAGQPVVAIGLGTVVQRLEVSAGWPGGVRGVAHTVSDGTLALAVYAHINPKLSVGKKVTPGMVIGTIYNQGSNSHLHLGIRPLGPGEDPRKVVLRGSSACTSTNPAETFGYVDPIPWLADHAAKISPSLFQGHVVQWDGDTNSQKTSWMVNSGKRRWIPDTFSYVCWKTNGAPGPDVLSSAVLDQLPDQPGQQALCTLPVSTYEGHIVQWDGDTSSQKTSWLVKSGKRYWIPDGFSYSCWKSKGAPGPDVLPSYGLAKLPDQTGQQARCIPPLSTYEGYIVQWDADTNPQKTAWLVRAGKRFWIPDSFSYFCWKNKGAPGPEALPSYVLDKLSDQAGQRAECIPPASSFDGHIVQWDGDSKPQKTSWVVSGRKRYWIPDSFSYYCWKNKGAPGPDVLPSYVLNTLPDQIGSAAGRCIPPASTYEGHVVQWDGDSNQQKTSWIVRGGLRYWVPDSFSYFCWKNRGAPGPDVLPSYALDSLPDQVGSTGGRCIPPASTYDGHIVQWDGDAKTQKTAWLVGPDGHRRWISDTSTYSCLKNRGAPGPDVLPSYVLDTLADLNGVWAVCDDSRIGVDSMLQRGFDLRSTDGRYHLELQRDDGNLVLYNASGRPCWATYRYGADFLILQSDGNLVAYRRGGGAVWASNTVGSGAVWLYVQSDGNVVMYNSAGRAVWATNTVGC